MSEQELPYAETRMNIPEDPVVRPAHYRQGEMEVITAIEGLGLAYHAGNVLKYVARYRYKNGVEDLRKAAWYLERLIEREQRS